MRGPTDVLHETDQVVLFEIVQLFPVSMRFAPGARALEPARRRLKQDFRVPRTWGYRSQTEVSLLPVKKDRVYVRATRENHSPPLHWPDAEPNDN